MAFSFRSLRRSPVLLAPLTMTALSAAAFAITFRHTAPLSTSARVARQLAAVHDDRETHLANVRQLTFGGQNAEAYFSPDGQSLTFQSQRDGQECDQQYVMRTDGSGLHRISTGTGRTTCGWFYAAKTTGRAAKQSGSNKKDAAGGNHAASSGTESRVLFSSTHEGSPACPPKPDYSLGYVWPVYPTYRIYSARPDGSDLRPLYPRTLKPRELSGYNAESVVSPDGKRVVFTSDRGGDLDIYTMHIDGTHVRQLTHALGYDGGPWWSPNGKQICFRAYHPKTSGEIADYKALLGKHLIRPTTLDLFVMDADGGHLRQITDDRAANIANFAPSWTPNGKGLVFASNRDDPKRRKFEVYKINLDGTGLERITYGEQFDGFPNLSPDGKRFVWASNRNGREPHETNLFIADWIP